MCIYNVRYSPVSVDTAGLAIPVGAIELLTQFAVHQGYAPISTPLRVVGSLKPVITKLKGLRGRTRVIVG